MFRFFQQKGTSTVDSLHEEFEALQSELKGHTAANAKIVDAALFGRQEDERKD